MRLISAAILAAFLLPGIALAAPDCMTPDAVTTKLLHRYPHLHVVNLTGKEAQVFLVAFNALPPASDFKTDRVLAFTEDGRPATELVLFIHGCMTRYGEVPADLIAPLIGQAG